VNLAFFLQRIVHTDQLNRLAGKVTVDTLHKGKMINDSSRPVKIVSRGDLTTKLQLIGIEATASAKAQITKAGGSLGETPDTSRPRRHK